MGELFRKGESRPFTRNDLGLYEQARSTQHLHEVPVLQRSDNRHEYLFFGLFDGTGQDADNPKQLLTNVGLLREQLNILRDDPDNRIGYDYVAGIGTQSNPLARYKDALIPHSWAGRIENAYLELATQTKIWREQDPDAQIRVAHVGYSRGAVLSVGLARLVDQYGIANPDDLRFGRDAHGNITVQGPHPPLVEPGQAAQAMGLYDPVATHLPDDFDARRPGSVISAVAMAAAHEQRVAFPHQAILQPGLSSDRRFANLLMPGGHSNVGGGNRDPGAETMAFNSMADYLNGLRDTPLFTHRPLPDDPDQYTVHQARGPTAVPGLDRSGLREVRQDLANCKIVDPCRDGEPVNRALAEQFEYRRLQPTAPLPALAPAQRQGAAQQAEQPQRMTSFADPHVDRAYSALLAGDSDQLDRIAIEFAQSPAGRHMAQQGDQWLARQQATEHRQMQERQATQRQADPVLSR
ncbi:DUF2235 domain-containing protein [Luteimonas aestuarii]|uniref:DUF2235 domain-containing protein n=1 Tax=Luteimonas aestuarii TaxID=453837 RepID=A0A4V3AL98_9GAMM|nr:DUF2235 domain-containing protein [Luteimonas aestuarii]TDK20321.1 DUF2235 domain-containing protein [Luteimonas aestuarii]